MSGGGTGGHIFPALALAQRLPEVIPGAELLYIGAKMGMETEPELQLYCPCDAHGWHRTSAQHRTVPNASSQSHLREAYLLSALRDEILNTMD